MGIKSWKQSESFDLYVNWEDDSTRLLVWAKNGIIVSQYTLNKEWNSIPVVTDDYNYIYLSYINPSTLGKTTIKQKLSMRVLYVLTESMITLQFLH